MYMSTADLDTFARSATNPNGAWTADTWGYGRLILKLETNLDDVEMMGLVRNDTVPGSPVTNMSVGVSGDGCD
jgi:hypothetical protein